MTKVQDVPIKPFDGVPLSQFEGKWWVAHTKPRQEKALALDLYRSGCRYFAPVYEVKRRSKGRSWNSTLPLFAGYIFICGSEDDRLFALKTNRVANMIDVPDQAQFVAEITAINRLLETGLSLSTRQSLRKGAKCRICRGPVMGLEGRIERRQGKANFVVNVSILGQAVMVETEADLLEPLA